MERERPTIAELEKMLNDPEKPDVFVNPDGSVTASPFRRELESLLNRHNKEAGSSTPDFVLADYLIGCLDVFDRVIRRRAEWYGRKAGDGFEQEQVIEVDEEGRVHPPGSSMNRPA